MESNMIFRKKKTTNINGVDLDLSGVSIEFNRIAPDDIVVNIKCSSKSIDEQIKIVDTFKKIFFHTFQNKR